MKKVSSILLIFTLILSFTSGDIFADSSKELKGAWISTIYNMDWPSVDSKSSPYTQKKQYINILDKLKAIGINTVFVQIRPKGDALYKSSINPWSDVLTGTQGKNPGYDPLTFMIKEAHKRGISFHAWLNPYRITTSGTNLNSLASNHPARLNPTWVLRHTDENGNSALYYNPEKAEVKKHISDTVAEIVKNYDVDGIHFDDYFYPHRYPLPNGQSKDGYVANKRREHINSMISQVRYTIKKIKPSVQFGISPAGIWKNKSSDSSGSNTNGDESYYSSFADTRTWIQKGLIDYVVPQIYWTIGQRGADYSTLVKWWSNEVKNTKVSLYIGHSVYKDSVVEEIDKQIQLNKKYSNIKGSAFFSTRDLLSNKNNCADKIKNLLVR